MQNPISPVLVLIIVHTLAGCGGQASDATDQTADAATVGGRTQSSTGAIGGAYASGGTPSSGGSRVAPGGGSVVGSGGFNPGSGGVQSAGGSTSTASQGGRAQGGNATSTGGVVNAGGARTAGGVGGLGGATSMGGTAVGGMSSVGGLSGSTVGGGASGAAGAIAGGGVPTWPKKFCGNTTTDKSVDPAGLVFTKHWDQITPENAGKWGAVQAQPPGAFVWTTLDAFYGYAQDNGILFKQHCFVWGSAQPTGQNAATLEVWIREFCARYPKTALIDVVNEPPPHTTPAYAKALGEGETGTYPWITKSFKLARRYCGNAVLILNDYNNLEYASQQTHFIDIVKDIKAAGAPIDAIGAQAHATSILTAAQLEASLNKLATETGLPVYITEYDVPKASDTEQRDIFAAQFPIFWNSSHVRGVTVWGWIAGKTWVSDSGLVNGTTPRPAMTWLMDYLGRPAPP